MYVYIRSEPELWTVGFYHPDGTWQPESDHGSAAAARARVSYLNGGADPDLLAEVIARLQALEKDSHPPARDVVTGAELDALAARVARVEYTARCGR